MAEYVKVFSQFQSNQVALRPFYVHKQFIIDSSNTGSLAVSFYSGSLPAQFFLSNFTLTTEPTTSFDIEQRVIYRTIQHLYYNSNAEIETFGGVSLSEMTRSISDDIQVVAIPQGLMGEGIEPTTFLLTNTLGGNTLNIIDDGKGNLTDTGTGSGIPANGHCGNIFYNTGHVVITSDSARYDDVFTGVFEIVFRNNYKIYEREYTCEIKQGEFNQTLNPSARKEANLTSSVQADFTSGSFWSPYITTIGLYNNAGELLAIGKFARPVKKTKESDMTFVLRIDT